MVARVETGRLDNFDTAMLLIDDHRVLYTNPTLWASFCKTDRRVDIESEQ